jgi:hypothetical protein
MTAVMIGIDPHKGSHTAVAIGAAEEPLGDLRVRAGAEREPWAGDRPKPYIGDPPASPSERVIHSSASPTACPPVMADGHGLLNVGESQSIQRPRAHPHLPWHPPRDRLYSQRPRPHVR